MPMIPSPDTRGAGRWYSDARLWKKLFTVATVAGHKLVHASLVLFFCLKDPDTPLWAKGVIIGALGYLILPADLVPDLLPGAGYGDDWGAIVAALSAVAACIKDEHREKADVQLARILRIVDPKGTMENPRGGTDFVE